MEERKYSYDVDTPLSLEGVEQSVKTGEFLKSLPNIRVFSSPFTRCIQKAAGICKGSGANPEITILEELSEVHRFNSTAADISKLQVNRLGSSEFIRTELDRYQILQGPSYKINNPRGDQSKFHMNYPESKT